MNRLIDWAGEQLTDFRVMAAAFIAGFLKGMRK